MSGSIAAIAAYNGTGTQGYGTTDKHLPGVKSVFWNENDINKYYVNGCSFSEVSSNKGAITSPETVIFTFDNDIDAINDLVLTINASSIKKSSTNPTGDVPPWFMAGFIQRIEICIGNQVITTIPTVQIIDLIVSDKNMNFSHLGTSYDISLKSTYDSAYTNIRLPIFNLINEKTNCSYLMACANNQTLQVKVYPQYLTTDNYNNSFLQGPSISAPANGWHIDIDQDNNTFTFSLYANKYSMTNAERDMLRNQVIPKRTNITQSATISNPSSIYGYPNLNVNVPITINCDHFNINAEKIRIVSAGDIGTMLFNVELFLNSTSYFGSIISSVKDTDIGITYNNFLLSQLSNTGIFSIGPSGVVYRDIAEIYLAKNANKMNTDQNYVPLSKYDSIRVVLTPLKDVTSANYPVFLDNITVIVEGKCTALYQNGAVTFNNY